MCEGIDEIYSVTHSIVAEAACIYEVNPISSLIIDPADYLTH